MTAEMFRVFGRIGFLSFGGPAAQIALMHKELVADRSWLSEAEYLRALSFCMLLPGPEAMQLATYAGWKRAGIRGGLIGGGLFVLPGALLIACLAVAYGAYGELPWVQAMFLGVKATVVVIVIQALIKIAGRALKTLQHRLIALAAFVALFVFDLPFPMVIAIAGLIGAAGQKVQTEDIPVSKGHLRQSVRVIVIGCMIWAAPLLLLTGAEDGFLRDVFVFFSTLAIVTFGGAYAVLAYMTQAVVVDFGWISTAQMMDALGLAETTPGPLILVTQFVAMIAGLAQGGTGMALAAGALTLWVTFVPCFIWIFAGAPLIDWLAGRPRLQAALSGITASVVGVIANLSLWLMLHVFFGTIGAVTWGPVDLIMPEPGTFNLAAAAIALVAGDLLLWRHWPLPLVLLISASLGLLIQVTTASI